MPLIGHVQIASVPDRAEPDRSDIPLGPFLKALDDLGYDGWVGCEYKPDADTDAGLIWMEEMKTFINGDGQRG